MHSSVEYVVYVIPEANSQLADWASTFSAIAALCSAVAAIFALLYTRKQIKNHERHNRLMVTPHLSGWNHTNHTNGEYQFTLENTGIGPAVIRGVSLFVRGEQIRGWGADLIVLGVQKLLMNTKREESHEMFVVGDVIPPGKKFTLLHLKIENASAGDIQALILGGVTLKIRYESILGETYMFDSEELLRQRHAALS